MNIKGLYNLEYDYMFNYCIYKKSYNCKFCKNTFVFKCTIDKEMVNRLGYNIVTEYIEEKYNTDTCNDCNILIERRNKILKIKNRI